MASSDEGLQMTETLTARVGAPTLKLRYDPLDPDVLENPYPTYKRLRDSGRLSRGGPGQWVATHYDDVAALLHDPRLSHEFPPEYRQFSLGNGPASEFFGRIILTREPPAHTRLRQIMSAAFSASIVRRLHDFIERLVAELLDPALDRGHLDAVADLAYPIPVLVICELIGSPPIDRHEIRPRATDLAKAFGTYVGDADRRAADAAVVWLRNYVALLLDERRKHPGDDLLSQMLAGKGSDRLTPDEIVDNVVFMFFAGFETTMNVIATGCATFLQYPDAIARLRADASLMPTAVEEVLRYDAPIQSVTRLVLQPIQIGGQTIRPGRALVLILGSANHDERHFNRPELFDITRKPNMHVSFGGGIHHCLGALLARMEAAITFSTLIRRCSSLEPAGAATRRPSVGFRSYASIPLAIRPAGALQVARRPWR